MRRPASAVFVLLCLAATFVAAPSHAAWSTSGNLVIQTTKSENFAFFNPQDEGSAIAPDMSGGLVVAWVRGTDSLYVSRLNETGVSIWGPGAGGIALAPAGNIAGAPSVVSDGYKGAWIVWHDTRTTNPGTYVQRVRFDGSLKFAAGGIRVGPDVANNYFPAIAASSLGGLFTAWVQINTSTSATELHVSRIDTSGTLVWSPSGSVAASSLPTIASEHQHIYADGLGCVVVFRETTNSPAYEKVMAQRLDFGGFVQWGAGGVTVIDPGSTTHSVQRCDAAWNSSNGLTVAWIQGLGTASSLRAQRMSTAGVAQWTASGVVIRDSTASQNFRVVGQATTNGVIVGWMDNRNFNVTSSPGFTFQDDIFAQRLDASGAASWAAGGQRVIALAVNNAGEQDQLQMTDDGANGAWFIFRDRLLQISNSNPNGDIKLCRLSPTGTSLFEDWINRESSAQHEELDPVLAADGAGGAVAAWEDSRNASTDPDIYAAHRMASGGVFVRSFALTNPLGGQSFASLQIQPITWTSNIGGNVHLDYSLSGGAQQSIVSNTADDGGFSWTVPAINSTHVRVHVTENGEGAATDSSDTDLSVCPSLQVGGSFTTGTVPQGIRTGDFNEDGILDLAVGTGTGVSILLGAGSGGVGNGSFGAATNIVVTGGVRDLAVFDANGDGRLDLAVTTPTGVRILLGNGVGSTGNGTFTFVALLGGMNATGIAAGDFNHDGIVDLAVADSAADRVVIWNGTGANGVGNGSFASGATISTGSQPLGIAVADLNEDGHLDLAVVNSQVHTVTVALGAGDGTFPTHVDYQTGGGPRDVVVGDFNEDGILDLAIACNAAANGLNILLGHGVGGVGDGTFPTASVVSTAGLPCNDLAVLDLDGDGRSDIAMAANNGSIAEVQALFGNGSGHTGNGTFATGGQLVEPSQISAWRMVSGDFNEDGHPDLAVTNSATTSVTILLGGCNTFASSVTMLSPNGHEDFFVGEHRTLSWDHGGGVLSTNVELSTDGGANYQRIVGAEPQLTYDWVVAPPTTNSARIRVFDPTTQDRVGASAANFAICSPFATAKTPGAATGAAFTTAARADFNGDGFDDVLMPATGGAIVQMGDGTGGFVATSAVVPLSATATALATGDFDENGVADWVAASGAGIWVELGQGTAAAPLGVFTGTFQPIGRGFSGTPSAVVVGDFNRDGIADLAVAGGAARDSVYVFAGLGANGVGNGTFEAPAAFPAGAFTGAMLAADVDGDGKLDLVLGAASGGNGVRVLLGNGSGGFGTATLYATPTSVRDLRAADLDGNGLLDLAVSCANQLVWLPGTGTTGSNGISFAAAKTIETLPVAGTGGQLAIADVDRDGHPDVVHSLAAAAGAGQVRLGLGSGGGAFEPTVLTKAIANTGALVLGDFDRDRQLDFVAGNGAASARLWQEFGCDSASGALAVVTPDSGLAMTIGSTVTIQWTRPAFSQSTNVETSRDGGLTWERIGDGVIGTSLAWQVTPPATNHFRVRVRDAAWSELHAESRADNSVLASTAVQPGSDPARVGFSPGWPNPAHGTTSFTLSLPAPGRVFVEVLDLAGRRLRTLENGTLAAGAHTVVWNGLDDNGAHSRPGVYFVRATAPGLNTERRVVMLR